ncbi:MAG: hypothetical protein MCS20_02045 [Candidatus Phytoplasma mali]|nr:hypothetical protein [Candidatus Phytoplasma australiense]MBZ7920154.1 hypothetical protein [Candidatus Karelsulcia muelleri]MCG7202172.1 hypothetical protein [Candidatus Phytoplasma mali]
MTEETTTISNIYIYIYIYIYMYMLEMVGFSYYLSDEVSNDLIASSIFFSFNWS